MMKSLSKIILLFFMTVSLSACLYKLDIQQGNEITPQMVDRLSIGMTKRQVERTIGLPLISDPFNKNRWDYFYSYKEGRSGKVNRQSASLFFEGDKLVDIQSNFEIKKNADTQTKEAINEGVEEQHAAKQEEESPWWKFW